jgi:hypothetical protein
VRTVADDFVVTSIKRMDSLKRCMRSPRNTDKAVMDRWNSRGTRRATTGSFLYARCFSRLPELLDLFSSQHATRRTRN